MITLLITLLTPQIEDAPALLYVYGPLGIFCAFFMVVSTYLLLLGTRHVDNMYKEFRMIIHRLAGLEKVMLMDLVERDSTGIATKKYCREAIARIDSQLNNPAPR